MSNHYAGFVFLSRSMERQKSLRAGVHIAGGFVQYQHPRIGKHCARHRHKLLLSLGDAAALIAHRCVIALWKRKNVLVYTHGFGSGFRVLPCGFGIAVGRFSYTVPSNSQASLQHHCKAFSEGILVPSVTGVPSSVISPLCAS